MSNIMEARNMKNKDNNLSKTEIEFLVGVSSALGLRQLGLMLVIPFISIYGKTLTGSTPTLIGIALGVYGLTQACFQIPYGAISDKIGRKKIILIGMVQLFLGFLLAYRAKTIYGFILARALQGSGAVNAAAFSWVGEIIDKSKVNRAMGVLSAAIGGSTIVAIISSSLLQNFLTIPQIFLICAVLVLLAAIYILFVLRENYKIKEDQTSEDQNNQSLADIKVLKRKKMFFSQQLIKLYATGFNMNFLLVSVFFIVPQLLEPFYGVVGMWKVFIPAAVVGMLVMKQVNRLADKGKQQLMQSISFVVVLIGILCFYPNYKVSLSVGLIIFFTGFLCLNSLQQSGINIIADDKHRGTINGISNTIQFIGSFLGGVVSGAVWGINHRCVVILLAIAGLIGLLVLSYKADNNKAGFWT
jgi:MFS family permease